MVDFIIFLPEFQSRLRINSTKRRLLSFYSATAEHLALKGEAGTNLFPITSLARDFLYQFNLTHLVSSLVDLLGIERGANANGDTGAQEDVIGDGSNTAVVDFGLVVVSKRCHNRPQ
jgi:hypothetical protein